MKNKTLLSVSITFITSFTFLMLTLFIFESFGWNVIIDKPISIIRVGFIYGILSILTLFILNFYLAFKLKDSMDNIDMKKIMRFLTTKLLLDFLLSSLMIYLSLLVFNAEIAVNGFFTNLFVMILTFVFREIFQIVISYRQNKDKMGGM